LKKYFCFRSQISHILCRLSFPTHGRGRLAIVTDARPGSGGRDSAVIEGAARETGRRSVWVLMPRCLASSLREEGSGRVEERPITGEITKENVKPLRGDGRVTRCDRGDLTARGYYHNNARRCGPNRATGIPEPSIGEGRTEGQPRAKPAARSRKLCLRPRDSLPRPALGERSDGAQRSLRVGGTTASCEVRRESPHARKMLESSPASGGEVKKNAPLLKTDRAFRRRLVNPPRVTRSVYASSTIRHRVLAGLASSEGV